MRSSSLQLLVWLAATAATSAGSCSNGYVPCYPKGAEPGNPPDIGPEMVDFYVDLLSSVKGHGHGREKRSLNKNHGVIARRGEEGELCCESFISYFHLLCLYVSDGEGKRQWTRLGDTMPVAGRREAPILLGEFVLHTSLCWVSQGKC